MAWKSWRRVVLGLGLILPGSATAGEQVWGARGRSPAELMAPLGLASGASRVVVADFDNDRVQVWSEDGRWIAAWGATGDGPGEFRGPTGVALDATGQVYVADHFNGRIQVFGPEGAYVGAWMLPDDRRPFGVAVGQGRVWITEFDAGRVSAWTPAGELLAEWTGFVEPWGVAVDRAGIVWVGESGADRVRRLAGDSWEVVSANPAPRRPTALAADPAGGVAVLAADVVIQADGSLVAHDAGFAAGLGALAEGWLVSDMSGDRLLAGTSPRGGAGVRLDLAARPSPARERVAFAFALPGSRRVTVTVVGVDGRRVWSHVEVHPGGPREVTWDTRDAAGHPVPAGLYFVRLETHDGMTRERRSGRIAVVR